MSLQTTPICDFDWPAPEFSLPDPEGHVHSLASLRGANGTLVMFLCNHCPYVKAVLERVLRDTRDLEASGIASVAINPNDPSVYPEDAPEQMARLAREMKFPFPYLVDETQDVARAYQANCTPDFFGFNARLRLQYRGRLDESRMSPVPDARRDLFEAMVRIAKTGEGPSEQSPSMGCSIKWRGVSAPA